MSAADSRAALSRLSRHRVPVILVSGVDEGALLSTSLGLHLDLPGAVAVRHVIDAERQMLTRVVSDLTGVIERQEIDLEHACVSCAIREDIVPTLQRLGESGRWSSIVACLPIAAEAQQVCRVLAAAPRTALHVFIAAVVAGLDGTTVVEDLLGDDLLAERGLETSAEDRRGVAEVASALVEYADLVCLTKVPDDAELSLVGALARPGVPVVTDASTLDAASLMAGVHIHQAAEAWIAEIRRGELPPLPHGGVWRLDLRSDRPFHPLRFQEGLAGIGGGPHRSRGCFWLPTRPGVVCVWDAAGGQAAVGSSRTWGTSEPMTRITVIGLEGDDTRSEIEATFERCLVTDDELASRGRVWQEGWDGFEPWLGPIESVA